MNRNDSRPILKTSGVGNNFAEFNYAPIAHQLFVFAIAPQPNPNKDQLTLRFVRLLAVNTAPAVAVKGQNAPKKPPPEHPRNSYSLQIYHQVTAPQSERAIAKLFNSIETHFKLRKP